MHIAVEPITILLKTIDFKGKSIFLHAGHFVIQFVRLHYRYQSITGMNACTLARFVNGLLFKKGFQKFWKKMLLKKYLLTNRDDAILRFPKE